MKKRRDIIFIVLFITIVSISLIYLFQTSYAKYRRNTNGEVQGRVASWDIKVNNESITTNTTLTNKIVPTIDDSNYVKQGTIAPGSTGYFDLIIDATNVDVDFTYTITGEIAEETPLEDLIIKGYKVNDGSLVNFNSTTGITGDIPMNTSQTTIRVYFEWDDSDTNNMDNQEDTEYAQNEEYSEPVIKISIHFEQKR